MLGGFKGKRWKRFWKITLLLSTYKIWAWMGGLTLRVSRPLFHWSLTRNWSLISIEYLMGILLLFSLAKPSQPCLWGQTSLMFLSYISSWICNSDPEKGQNWFFFSSGTTQGKPKFVPWNEELFDTTLQIYHTSFAFRNRFQFHFLFIFFLNDFHFFLVVGIGNWHNSIL